MNTSCLLRVEEVKGAKQKSNRVWFETKPPEVCKDLESLAHTDI